MRLAKPSAEADWMLACNILEPLSVKAKRSEDFDMPSMFEGSRTKDGNSSKLMLTCFALISLLKAMAMCTCQQVHLPHGNSGTNGSACVPDHIAETTASRGPFASILSCWMEMSGMACRIRALMAKQFSRPLNRRPTSAQLISISSGSPWKSRPTTAGGCPSTSATPLRKAAGSVVSSIGAVASCAPRSADGMLPGAGTIAATCTGCFEYSKDASI
mmetsp:Transcript_50536/g.146907  ORF Transcript_50536/g.146907 Transcript_50536/m.146907 type:complete len:216 (-) Transcript_50536:294-941(-)